MINFQLPQNITEIRQTVYRDQGFFLIKDFLTHDCIHHIQNFWTYGNLVDYQFSDSVKNKDVTCLTYPYLLKGNQGNTHKSYCLSIFNSPIDIITHEVVFHASILRNLVSDLPVYESLTPSSPYFQQYRVIITRQDGIIVGEHSDYMEELRSDSLVPHDYDPSRLQMTLFMSNYGVDYIEGGFYFKQNNKRIYSHELGARAGDLLIWMYNLPHGVDNLKVTKDSDLGFARIIFPLVFNNNSNA